MIQQTPETDTFKLGLRELLKRETTNSRALVIKQNNNIYTIGDKDETVYFIESGQAKLVMLSPEGKECIIAIHTVGDIFGILCLSGLGERCETVTAMVETTIKQMSHKKFISLLSDNLLLAEFVRYLAARVADQQQAIANLLTIDSEKRLGQVLLQLARTLGKKDPKSILINLKITHEELSNMVGTTRPRISLFMQRFKHLGLLEINKAHCIIIKEHALVEYLETGLSSNDTNSFTKSNQRRIEQSSIKNYIAIKNHQL